jgi:hypothetical protein
MSSHDRTIWVWYTEIGKSLHDHAEEDSSASSPHCSCIPPPTLSDDFISFSSNSTHVLCDTTELLAGAPHDGRRSTFTFLGKDGWMMLSNHQVSFWVIPASQKAFYNRWTTLVIGTGCIERGLNHMPLGTRWHHCYKERVSCLFVPCSQSN